MEEIYDRYPVKWRWPCTYKFILLVILFDRNAQRGCRRRTGDRLSDMNVVGSSNITVNRLSQLREDTR